MKAVCDLSVASVRAYVEPYKGIVTPKADVIFVMLNYYPSFICRENNKHAICSLIFLKHGGYQNIVCLGDLSGLNKYAGKNQYIYFFLYS